MRKTYYYFIVSAIVALFFSIPAKAYSTSLVTGTGTSYDGRTITVRANSFSSVPYDSVEQWTDSQGNTKSVYNWNLVQELQIYGFATGKYYNGYIYVTISTTPSISSTDVHSPVMLNTELAQGVHAFIGSRTGSTYQVIIFFDNFYTTDGWIGLSSIEQEAFLTDPGITNIYQQNFTVSVSNVNASSVKQSDTATTNGLAGVITAGIDNSTALATIAGWLYDIKEADYQYYQGLISQISSILSAQGTTNARLLSILNEIDLDFQQVQTILDLFPSYRTQVLQYWQELLQMNSAQSSVAAEVESQYADRESQSSQLINGMGSVVMPSISSGDLDIMSSVDQTQKANFFGLIALISHNQLVTKIMLIIVLGAIVGYILYGKR